MAIVHFSHIKNIRLNRPETRRKAGVQAKFQRQNRENFLTLSASPENRKSWQRPYNGFSYRERCAVTPIQNKAIKEGRLVRSTVCSICLDDRDEFPKGRDYRFLHTEDYSRPLDIYPCCKRCHAALHARFDDPARWLIVAKENWREGAWFTHLSMDPQSQYQPFEVTYPDGLKVPRLEYGQGIRQGTSL